MLNMLGNICDMQEIQLWEDMKQRIGQLLQIVSKETKGSKSMNKLLSATALIVSLASLNCKDFEQSFLTLIADFLALKFKFGVSDLLAAIQTCAR